MLHLGYHQNHRVAKNTIQKLTRDLGKACLRFQDHMLRNLPSKRIKCEGIW